MIVRMIDEKTLSVYVQCKSKRKHDGNAELVASGEHYLVITYKEWLDCDTS
jgi:hypothetical protein